MKELKNWLMEEESGQGLVEYALIVGFIALVCVVAVQLSGNHLHNFWNDLNNNLNSI